MKTLPKVVRKWFPLRFHNRLLLYNTLIFLVVAYMLAFIATRYSLQLDTVKQLQMSRDALNAICNFYDRKHDQFVNLILPLYEIQDNYEKISRLLESKSDQEYETDPYLKMDIVKILQNLALRDSDIAAVFIRKNLTRTHYLYLNDSRTLDTVGPEYVFFKDIPETNKGRLIFGTRFIEGKTASPLPVYGISGTLGSQNIRANAGQLLVAYKTSSIDRLLQSYNGKTQGRFMLLTKDGDVIYDSEARYGYFKEMAPLLAGMEKGKIGGKTYYIQTVTNVNRNYIGVNLVSTDEVVPANPHLPFLIYGAISAMAVICVLLYALTGSLVSKRVHELVTAMKRVGSNNLSYRVPVNGRRDEFGELAMRFNRMCEELEEMINREYISEIRKKNAELNALQSGINPHFLYNTLEAIRVKAFDDGNGELAEMIVLLANLYRSIVRDDTFIPIRKELNMCGMYLNIFALRYAGSHLDYSIEVEPAVMEYGIPKNLLQPIIENYFVHGLRDREDDNRFAVSGKLRDGEIEFVFEDNGRGIDRSRLDTIMGDLASSMEPNEKRPNYGLLNVQERIRLVYGESYGIAVTSTENVITRVTVRIQALTCRELESRIRNR